MIRGRLTYANVASTLALVLALSGAAYAVTLGPNTVGTKQLKDNAVTKAKLHKNAVNSSKVIDGSLRVHDLGGSYGTGERTVGPISVPDSACRRILLVLENPAPAKGFVGSLVTGYISDASGDAVLDNFGFIVPTNVSKTTQGGAEAELLVCDAGGGGQTVPAGSVVHYRIIGP